MELFHQQLPFTVAVVVYKGGKAPVETTYKGGKTPVETTCKGGKVPVEN